MRWSLLHVMLHLAKATTATSDGALEPLKPEHALPQSVCRRCSSQAVDGSCKNADRDALLDLRSNSAPSTSTLLITWRRLAEEATSVALLDGVVYLPPSESATSHSGLEFVRTALPDPASCIQSALGAPSTLKQHCLPGVLARNWRHQSAYRGLPTPSTLVMQSSMRLKA